MTTSPAEDGLNQTPPEPAKGKTGKGLGIAALALGILGFIPILGIIPAVLGVVFGRRALKRPLGRGVAVGGIITSEVALIVEGGFVVLALLIFVMGNDGHAILARQARCQANCNAIGKAIFLYANDHADLMPPDLETLIKAGLLKEEELHCPVCKSRRSCDYFYLPSTSKWDETNPATIILCDYKGNHGGDNMRSVLTASFAVIHRREVDFQEDFKLPCNAAFAKALRQAEGP